MYLELRHGANELIGHLDIGAVGVIQWDELRGQVLVAVEESGKKVLGEYLERC